MEPNLQQQQQLIGNSAAAAHADTHRKLQSRVESFVILSWSLRVSECVRERGTYTDHRGSETARREGDSGGKRQKQASKQ